MYISFEWIDGINFKWESLQYKIILFIQQKYNETDYQRKESSFFHMLCNILYDLKLKFRKCFSNVCVVFFERWTYVTKKSVVTF